MLGEVVADPALDAGSRQRLAVWIVSADDPDGDAFEGVGVVDAADVEVVDTWHALEDCCDGLGVDVFAADDDHVVAAGHDVQEALVVEVTEVAHFDEAVDSDHGRVGVGVAAQGGFVVEEDAPDGAGGDFAACVVVDAQGGAGWDAADAGRCRRCL